MSGHIVSSFLARRVECVVTLGDQVVEVGALAGGCQHALGFGQLLAFARQRAPASAVFLW